MKMRPASAALLGSILALRIAAAADLSRPGLLATATDGRSTAVFVAPAPHLALGDSESIHPLLAPAFRVEWTGILDLPRDGEYRLAGPGEIELDGRPAAGGALDLAAGPHALRLAWTRSPTSSVCRLTWESDTLAAEPVPASRLRQAQAAPAAETDAQREAARLALDEFNCAACHAADMPGMPAWRGPLLTGLGERIHAAWLGRWLANPRAIRPQAVMPTVIRDPAEQADVVAYLAGLPPATNLPSGPQGPVEMSQAPQGKVLYDTVGCTACHNEQENRLAGLGSKQSAAALARYLANPLAFDPSGRMPDLLLTEAEASAMAAHLVQERSPELEKAPPAGDPVRGKELTRSRGCLHCHDLDDPGRIESTLAPPARLRADAARGCLAENPSEKAPQYDLSAGQRTLFLSWLREPDRHAAPLQDYRRQLSFYRCVGCHEYHAPARVAFERPPPLLGISGDKLRPPWLDQVLLQKKRIRPWLGLRMPHYGDEPARRLRPHIPACAGRPPGFDVDLSPGNPEQIRSGTALIGRGLGGLSCISCHDFRGIQAGAEIRGPDMVEMRDRLQGDWTRRWLRDPSRYVPGTAMPSFFVEMPEAQAEEMLAALLQTLGAGRGMPDPAGLAAATSGPTPYE